MIENLSWKVCGLRDLDNIQEISKLRPDYMGFIFYDKSPRRIEGKMAETVRNIKQVQKVGVFVDTPLDEILGNVLDFGLDVIQLHGHESPEICKSLQVQGLKVIKVFQVDKDLPLDTMTQYLDVTDYFLFDTKTEAYGGSGKHFNWNLLNTYTLDKPFFLSGGIELSDISIIKSIQHPQLLAIDVNSRFEIEPGLKDIQKLGRLKNEL